MRLIGIFYKQHIYLFDIMSYPGAEQIPGDGQTLGQRPLNPWVNLAPI